MARRLLIRCVLAARRQITPDVAELRFTPTVRAAMPRYRGGAHTLVRLASGAVRQYSLCGPPADTAYVIAVRRKDDGRGGSVELHRAAIGDEYFLSHPQEEFGLEPGATRHVFVAGGVGVTPVLSMVRELSAAGEAGTALVHLYARDVDHAPYADELADLGAEVHVHLGTDPQRSSVDEVLAGVHRPGTHVYTCGPASMMDDVERATADWPEGSVHFESFVVSAAPAGTVLGEAFPVRLALSGKELVVGARQTLLQRLLDAGIPIEYACEGGICGTCVLDVVQGEVDHRDSCLSEAGRAGAIVSCVSRGRGPLTVVA
jgi:vanillate O-demethylase ferredoxin subunit